jgi:hypothetical protein
MLVVHWAKHNKTSSILANGIRPSYRRRDGDRRNSKGLYVYPFSRNKTLNSNWRRNLKTWDTLLGNYNGFIFRLVEEDFPLIAGYWFSNSTVPEEFMIPSLAVLGERYGDIFTGKILNPSPEGLSYNWRDFEIIIPRHVRADRIERVLKDREPKAMRRTAI